MQRKLLLFLRKLRRMLRRRLSLVCLGAILVALCVTAGIYVNQPPAAEPAPVPAPQTPAPVTFTPAPLVATHNITVPVGTRQYAFTLRTTEEALRFSLPCRVKAPDVRALRTRTVYRSVVWRDSTAIGTVRLTFDQSEEGTVFYVRTDLPVEEDTLYLELSTPADDTLTVRPIHYGDSVISAAEEPVWDTPYPASAALYLEGGGVHLRTARISALRGLGQTVHTRRAPEDGVTLARKDAQLFISFPLASREGEQLTVSGVLTEQPGVHWDDGACPQNVLNLEASSTDYHLLDNGVYITMPEDYTPRAESDRHIYRAATAWLLGPCTYETNGPMFTAIGKSILYTYLDNVNTRGFLPTEPTSGWLLRDFGIGSGFYDTRFNFDTMKRLMRAETVWDDHEIGQTVQRMLDFYCAFADRNRFEFLEHTFVPDYGDASGDSKGTLSSLNHYLAEGLLLLRAGDAYGNEKYTARGWEVVDAINETYYRWIRDNADLWYGVYPDGWLRRGDYVEVTYNDLIDAAALLDKYGRWEEYEGIQILLHEKERWLRLAGRPELLEEHAAFTFAD